LSAIFDRPDYSIVDVMKIVRFIVLSFGLLFVGGLFLSSASAKDSLLAATGEIAPEQLSLPQIAEEESSPHLGPKSIYTALDSLIDPIACYQAGLGYSALLQKGSIIKPIIVLADFGVSSENERLFIIDMRDTSIVHRSLVAHGQNSGVSFANTFSNVTNSYCSSRGFYHTAETYQGKHGLSLKLDGLEAGVNDNARKRAVVIHSAKYVSDDFIKENGRLGLSLGCPSLPEKNYESVIHAIKEGALLYIHSPLGDYHRSSPLIGIDKDKRVNWVARS